MREKWFVVAVLAFACCLVVGVGGAAAEDVPPVAPEAPPASEEGPPAAPEAPPASEEVSPESEEGAATLLGECPNGYVCAYANIFYGGGQGNSLCTGGAHPLGGWKESALNRCANKAAWFRVNGTAQTCRNAGGQLEVGGFNEIWIGAEGSHC